MRNKIFLSSGIVAVLLTPFVSVSDPFYCLVYSICILVAVELILLFALKRCDVMKKSVRVKWLIALLIVFVVLFVANLITLRFGSHGASERVVVKRNEVSVESISVIKYGLFSVIKRDVGASRKESATSELVPFTSAEFLETRDEIFSELGVSFGIMFVINGTPANGFAVIDVIVEHPPFNDDIDIQSHSLIADKVSCKYPMGRHVGYTYTFDDEKELVEGVWRMKLFADGQFMASKDFKVVSPNSPANKQNPESGKPKEDKEN